MAKRKSKEGQPAAPAPEEPKSPSVSDEIADLLGRGGKEEGEEEPLLEEESTEAVEGEEKEEVEEEEVEEGEEDETTEPLEEGEEEGEVEEGEEEEEEEEEEGEEEEVEEKPLPVGERAELLNQIAELRTKLDAVVEGGKKGKKSEEDEEPDFKFDEFLNTEESYEEALQSRESFNKVLAEVARQASLAAMRAAMQRVSPLITARVAEQVTNQQLVADFFRSNPELVPARRFVATVFTQIQAENPDKSYAELLGMTAREARSQLGLVQGARKVAGKVKGRKMGSMPPGRRGAAVRGTGVKAPRGIGAEIEEMLGGRR